MRTPAKLTVIDLLRKYSTIMIGNTTDGTSETGEVFYKVFVYGTLKKGGRLHQCLADSEFIGNDSLKGYHMMDCGSFPAIYDTHATDDNVVHGEVYSCSQKLMGVLDKIEGVPTLYRRQVVQLEECGASECYVQSYPNYRQEFERVLGGRWKVIGDQMTALVRNGSFQGREKPRFVYNRELNQYVDAVTGQVEASEVHSVLPFPRHRPPVIIEQEPEKQDDSINAYEKFWGKPTKAPTSSTLHSNNSDAGTAVVATSSTTTGEGS